MQIIYHAHFVRSYKKLPREIKIEAENKETIFRQNPFDPRLHTHKLHGKLKNLWSFSIDEKYRILFQFAKNKKEVIFLDVGDHDLYK